MTELKSIDNDYKTLYIDLMKKTLMAAIYEESAWQIIGGKTLDDAVAAAARKKNSLAKIFVTAPRELKKYVNKLEIDRKARRGLMIVKRRPFDAARRENGTDWPMFGYTMIGRRRLDNLQACIEAVIAEQIPGDIVETGVWRGGAMIFARAVLKVNGVADRRIWCADSFEGLPPQRWMRTFGM